MSQKRVAAIVLAAGRSSRMGAPKQLLAIEGQPLLRRTVETVLASHVDATVVVSQHFSALEALPVIRAPFYHAPNGLSDSMKNGLRALEEALCCDAALFVPCDLPLLSSTHLNALIACYRQQFPQGIRIVASRYAGVEGVPMLFDRALWSELEALQGDVGGRKIAAQHPTATTSVEFAEGQFDLDTPADVQAFERRITP